MERKQPKRPDERTVPIRDSRKKIESRRSESTENRHDLNCPKTDFEMHNLDIIEAIPFYVMLIDEHHRILHANNAVRKHLGLKPEDIVGKYCPEVIHGLKEPWYACPLEEAVEKGQAVEREALDKESQRWIRSAIYPTGKRTVDGARIFFHMISDITDRKEAEVQLIASRKQLRELSRHLETIREEERTRMAREVHDELGHTLTALNIDLSWLSKRLPTDQKLLLKKIDSMYELLDSAIQSVKRISTELRPGVLDDLGLTLAVEWQAQEFNKLTGIEVRFSSRPNNIVLDRDRTTAIFRICQEALTNVIRHADATHVKISLAKRDGRILLRISDNGKGIQEKQISDSKSFGLIGMRERVHYWKGEVKIKGIPGQGTALRVSIPLAEMETLDAENPGS